MILLANAEETEAFGAALAGVLRRGDVVAIGGALGAGKTVLARGVLRGLGFSGDVTSPTFPIVTVYDDAALPWPVWHVDLYRVEHRSELEELGLDEGKAEGVLLIEWPERLGAALWPESLQLRLERSGQGEAVGSVRALTAIVPPAWEQRWPPR